MSKQPDVLIVGAGPGGLACAKVLAENGTAVTVIERNTTVGPKVCAGGITWSGLIRHVPEKLIERSFARQYIFSNLQQTCVEEKNPIVATIGRPALGKWMAQEATKAGAALLTGARLTGIRDGLAHIQLKNGTTTSLPYTALVGADGSTSMVRKLAGIPSSKIGSGIHYQIPGYAEKMEWHVNSKLFGSGYAWIFPHRDSISIGAYGSHANISPHLLHKRFLAWAATKGYDLKLHRARAALINFDYRGIQFGNLYLVGDAAGLASGLTGEGLYPAIISGQAVARKILDPTYPAHELTAMVRKQKHHNQLVAFSSRNRLLCSLFMEALIMLLRLKILDFHSLEMAECS